MAQDSSPSAPPDRRFFPELEGLRGIAILLVLEVHLGVFTGIFEPLFTLFPALKIYFVLGWCGVDLFFVLSGFFIGGILIDHGFRPGFFGRFFLRRTFRIVPVFYLFLVVTMLWTAWRRPTGLTGAFAEVSAWTYFAFVHNFYIAAGCKTGLQLTYLWSLAVEEQFYLLAAAIRVLCRGSLALWLLALAAVGSIGLRFLMHDQVVLKGWEWWHFTPTRLDGLALGVAIAWIFRQPAWCERLRGARGLHRTVIVLLAACIASLPYLVPPGGPNTVSTPEGVMLLTVLFGGIVLYLVLHGPESRWLGGALRLPPLRWIGRVSYFLYVFHILAFQVAVHIWRTVTLGPDRTLYGMDLILALVLLGLGAWLSWNFLERPLLARAQRIPYGRAQAGPATEGADAPGRGCPADLRP